MKKARIWSEKLDSLGKGSMAHAIVALACLTIAAIMQVRYGYGLGGTLATLQDRAVYLLMGASMCAISIAFGDFVRYRSEEKKLKKQARLSKNTEALG